MQSGDTDVGRELYLLEEPQFTASVLLLQLIDAVAQILNVFLALVDRVHIVTYRRHVPLHVDHLDTSQYPFKYIQSTNLAFLGQFLSNFYNLF